MFHVKQKRLIELTANYNLGRIRLKIKLYYQSLFKIFVNFAGRFKSAVSLVHRLFVICVPLRLIKIKEYYRVKI